MSSAATAIVIFIATVGIFIGSSLHQIQEGHVGVYWRGGALLQRITDPGWHLMIPFLDHVEQVQVTLQTDKVENIPCGTSGGTMITIERVEVVNKLRKEFVYETIKNYTVNYDKVWIFDKIHHELNQFCSKHTLQEVYIDLFHTVDDRLQAALQESCDRWAPGMEIIAIRITKPKIPAHILHNYEQMEAEKTKLLVAVEQQKVKEKEAETEKKRATIEAEKEAVVSKINMERQIQEKLSLQKMKQIEDEMMVHNSKAKADAEAYSQQKRSESNQLLLSPAYLQLQLIQALGNNTKTYFGPSLNALVLDFFDVFQKSSFINKT